jgi:hypothetical protein
MDGEKSIINKARIPLELLNFPFSSSTAPGLQAIFSGQTNCQPHRHLQIKRAATYIPLHHIETQLNSLLNNDLFSRAWFLSFVLPR